MDHLRMLMWTIYYGKRTDENGRKQEVDNKGGVTARIKTN